MLPLQLNSEFTHATDLLHQRQLNDLTDIVSKTLTIALVLHPVACGLAFISLVFTLFALYRRRRHFQKYGTERDGRSRFTSIISFAIILPAALLTTAVFVVDVVLVAVARNRVRDALNGNRSVVLTWDSAVSPNTVLLSSATDAHPSTCHHPLSGNATSRSGLLLWQPLPSGLRSSLPFAHVEADSDIGSSKFSFCRGPLRSLFLLPSFGAT